MYADLVNMTAASFLSAIHGSSLDFATRSLRNLSAAISRDPHLIPNHEVTAAAHTNDRSEEDADSPDAGFNSSQDQYKT